MKQEIFVYKLGAKFDFFINEHTLSFIEGLLPDVKADIRDIIDKLMEKGKVENPSKYKPIKRVSCKLSEIRCRCSINKWNVRIFCVKIKRKIIMLDYIHAKKVNSLKQKEYEEICKLANNLKFV